MFNKKEYFKNYYRNHKKRIQEMERNRYQKNREKILKQKKDWREKNKEKVKFWRKRYLLNHPEYKQWKKRKRRAREKNAEGNFTYKDWLKKKEEFNFQCAFCKESEPKIKLTIDHIIPLSKNGTNYISNIQPLCFTCNIKKNNKILL